MKLVNGAIANILSIFHTLLYSLLLVYLRLVFFLGGIWSRPSVNTAEH
jgi:hypothetical protein